MMYFKWCNDACDGIENAESIDFLFNTVKAITLLSRSYSTYIKLAYSSVIDHSQMIETSFSSLASWQNMKIYPWLSWENVRLILQQEKHIITPQSINK